MRIGINPAKGTQVEVDDAYHRIVIPVYIPNLEGFFKESFEVLKLCLSSLYSTIHQKSKISIVSNGSCKKINDFLNNELEEKRIDELLIVKAGIGKINSIFKIINNVKEPIVTITDADVLFSSGWQGAVEQVFLDYDKVGMVCPFSYNKGYRELTANIFFDNFFNKNITMQKMADVPALEHFAKSINNQNFYSDIHKKYGITYQKNGKSKVLVGASHFVATYKSAVFEKFTFQPQLRKLANGERQFMDTPPVENGLWRVSTFHNYVYHMGNTVTPFYYEKISKNKNDLNRPFPNFFKIKKRNILFFKLVNIHFARIIYSKTIFNRMLLKFGLTKEEATLFVK